MRFAAITASLVLIFSSAPACTTVVTPVADALNRSVAHDDLAGGVAVIRHGPDDSDVTRVAAGYSDVHTNAGFAPHTHVRAASVTKTFVAATVMQLSAEKKIDLDGSVETYLPGRIHGDGIDAGAITVRQLLRHQSGLPEYFDKATPRPTEPVAAQRLLDMALDRPAQFKPGTAMKYTNTNYIVLGILIEKVTGHPAVDEITSRTIAPLGLADTYFPAPDDKGLRSPFARGYEMVNGRRTDVTAFNASAAWTSGGMVSTNEDMSAFITALLDGRVVPRPQLDQMMETVPMPDGDGLLSYGLGLGKVSLPCGVTAWGHGGDIDGYHSYAVKTVNGPAISMTLTQSPQAASPTEDPRADVLMAQYCAT